MVSRWFIALQELNFEVKFVPGKDNEMADSLSRLCPNLIELAVDYTPVVMDGSVCLMAALEICPSAMDENLEWIEQCHNGMIGHGGNARMLDKLASLGHSWPFMRSHVRSFIRHYPCCRKMSAVRIPIQLHHFASSTYNPFDTINMDFIGPFLDDSHVLVIIDTFSRWTELFWCLDAIATSACRALLQHFDRFGAPNLIRSDRGPHFVNHIIKDFLAAVGTGHNQTLAYLK